MEYELADEVATRLVLSYCRYSRTGKTKKIIRIRQNNDESVLTNRRIRLKNGTIRALTIDDLDLHVEHKKGDMVQRDITCNTAFMLDVMEELGRRIRNSFHWVHIDTPVYLFVDNAGGHGTNEAKKEYENYLKENWNVIIIWQPPNSPDVNLLDLGTWMSLQSEVEDKHRNRHMKVDVLARSVEEVFREYDGIKRISNIHARWKEGLELIVLGKGGNDLVEKKRGKKSSFDDLPTITGDNYYSSDDEVLDD
jgi:hypothetical protein